MAWRRSPCLPWLWLAYAQLRQSDLWPTFTGTGLTDHDRLRSEPNLTPQACDSYFGLTNQNDFVLHRVSGHLCTFTLNTQTLAETKPDAETGNDQAEEGGISPDLHIYIFYSKNVYKKHEAEIRQKLRKI